MTRKKNVVALVTSLPVTQARPSLKAGLGKKKKGPKRQSSQPKKKVNPGPRPQSARGTTTLMVREGQSAPPTTGVLTYNTSSPVIDNIPIQATLNLNYIGPQIVAPMLSIAASIPSELTAVNWAFVYQYMVEYISAKAQGKRLANEINLVPAVIADIFAAITPRQSGKYLFSCTIGTQTIAAPNLDNAGLQLGALSATTTSTYTTNVLPTGYSEATGANQALALFSKCGKLLDIVDLRTYRSEITSSDPSLWNRICTNTSGPLQKFCFGSIPVNRIVATTTKTPTTWLTKINLFTFSSTMDYTQGVTQVLESPQSVIAHRIINKLRGHQGSNHRVLLKFIDAAAIMGTVQSLIQLANTAAGGSVVNDSATSFNMFKWIVTNAINRRCSPWLATACGIVMDPNYTYGFPTQAGFSPGDYPSAIIDNFYLPAPISQALDRLKPSNRLYKSEVIFKYPIPIYKSLSQGSFWAVEPSYLTTYSSLGGVEANGGNVRFLIDKADTFLDCWDMLIRGLTSIKFMPASYSEISICNTTLFGDKTTNNSWGFSYEEKLDVDTRNVYNRSFLPVIYCPKESVFYLKDAFGESLYEANSSGENLTPTTERSLMSMLSEFTNNPWGNVQAIFDGIDYYQPLANARDAILDYGAEVARGFVGNLAQGAATGAAAVYAGHRIVQHARPRLHDRE